MNAPPVTPSPGRPRDATLDANILRAAMELLGDSGLNAVTMDAVAHRAGAGKASLYRRWRSKDELLADALALYSPVDVEIDTGSLREDLVKVYEVYYGIGNHLMQAAIQEMLGNVRMHHAWTEKVAPQRLAVRRATLVTMFERAAARGEIRMPADLHLILDVVPALVLYRFNMRSQKVTRASIAKVIDTLVLPLVAAPDTGERP
ncbi:TetR/AcrR family transcriptional regulator [Variovorax ginsengisoli]|uniref:AcrR family transcriptional regulator n=1 Tax=Variovorax ginsengisoli TaxID=363844 RepID=A0ABT9S7R7_9BURK|nr:TetR/AcrR family transcriptional regulator [Variovorax ginsengisoli]MDP9900403.1 AcrR family transcriptional regulator [Variovorax ginsengisoli]